MAFDHIMVASGDPLASASHLRRAYGLCSVAGPGLAGGLGSFIVPLSPPEFLQYVYISDLEEAQKSPFGQWLFFHRLSRLPDVLIGWAVRSVNLDAAATRLRVHPMSQIAQWAGGHQGRWTWRSVADSKGFSSLPILVEYDNLESHTESLKRLYEEANHDRKPRSIKAVETGVDQDLLHLWLLHEHVDAHANSECHGLRAAVIAMETGDDVILRS